jgi:hypothetical protein
LVDRGRLDRLREAIAGVNPTAEILECSARLGHGLEPWFERLLAGRSRAAAIAEIDYDRYALGESLRGWLNAEVRIGGSGADAAGPADDEAAEFDGNALLLHVLGRIRATAEAEGFEIAHLKGTLSLEGDPYELAAANLVQSADTAVLSHRLAEPVDVGRLLVNLRAEADPAILERAVRSALGGCGELPVEILHLEHFRPGRPVPTHRLPTRV